MKNDWIHSKRRIIVAAVILSLAFGLSAPATAQLRKINIAYTATSPYQAALIIAKEAGIFKKHGLDPQLILTPGGSLGFQAMMGGDVAMMDIAGAQEMFGRVGRLDRVDAIVDEASWDAAAVDNSRRSVQPAALNRSG